MGGSLIALVGAAALAISLFNWNMLRAPIAHFASDAIGRRVQIDGDLKVHLLTWNPQVSVGGLKVGQPAWIDNGSGDWSRWTSWWCRAAGSR